MYSPMLQRHIALARVPLDRTAIGSRVKLELAVNHQYEYFDARVVPDAPLQSRSEGPPDMPKNAKTASKGAPKAAPKAAATARRTSAADRTYDAIVIGGGHNGLTNGAYLAKAGLRTLILERRHLVGGRPSPRSSGRASGSRRSRTP